MFLKKNSNEAFERLWLEISFVNHENIVCAIIYHEHNSSDYFLTYLDKTIEKMMSDDKDVYIMGDFNIDLLKCESSQISQDFLLSLRLYYLIPTVDKPMRAHRTFARLSNSLRFLFLLDNPCYSCTCLAPPRLAFRLFAGKTI